MRKSFILIPAAVVIAIVAGQADAKGKKVKATDFNFTHKYDKASPVLSRSTSNPKSGPKGSASPQSRRR